MPGRPDLKHSAGESDRRTARFKFDRGQGSQKVRSGISGRAGAFEVRQRFNLSLSSLMFVKRVLAAILIGSIALALWRLSGLVILLFGAVLMAIGLRAAARLVDKATGVGAIAGLSLVVMAALASFAAVGWFFGSIIGGQVDELVRQVPAGLARLSATIEANPYARYVLEQARGMGRFRRYRLGCDDAREPCGIHGARPRLGRGHVPACDLHRRAAATLPAARPTPGAARLRLPDGRVTRQE